MMRTKRHSVDFHSKLYKYAYLILSVLAIVVLAAEPRSASAQTTVGTLPGQVGVSATGAATYSIPIAIPPGTGGMAPSLALQYSSQNGNGLVGMGWSLSGLPRITRCMENLAQDGARYRINFSSSDRFCLNGQRLVAISGTYGADGTVYRTEVDNFMQVVSHGTTGNGPTYFLATDRSGKQMEFGNTADSKAIAVGTSTVAAWAVDKVQDISGNYYTVSYINDYHGTSNPADGSIYPQYINYTGNASSSPGLAPYNYVYFAYKPRADIAQSYTFGSITSSDYILSNIETYNGSTLVSNYALTYTPVGLIKVNQLTQISLTAAGVAALPATSIIWSSTANAPNGTFAYVANNLVYGFSPATDQIVTGDFDGNGKTDILVIMPGASGGSIPALGECFRSNGGGAFVNSSFYFPTGVTLLPGTYQVASGDFDGDGMTDFAILTSTQIYVYISKGDGTFTLQYSGVYDPGYNLAFTENAMAVVSGDFNGDGYTDFAILETTTYYTFMSKGKVAQGTVPFTTQAASYNAPLSSAPIDFTKVKVITGDFDGDGKADFSILTTSTQYPFFSKGDGTFNMGPSAYADTGTSTYWTFDFSTYPVITGDFNGDGNTDYAVLYPGSAYIFLSEGNASFAGSQVTYVSAGLPSFSFSPTTGSPITGDFNGDGKTDFAILTANEIYVLLSNGSGGFSAVGSYYSGGGSVTVGNGIFPMLTASGDFDGNGLSDFTVLGSSGLATLMANGAPYSEISSITNGLGLQTQIAYNTIATGGTVYGKGASAIYPTQDYMGAKRVVTSVGVANGIGSGQISTNYYYSVAQTDLLGRGFLGFQNIRATSAQTGMVGITHYNLLFPYTGMVNEQTTVSGTVTLLDTVNTLSVLTPSTTGQTGGHRAFPYVSQSVATPKDLDGSVLPIKTTTVKYDTDTTGNYTYGNVTSVTVSTTDGTSSVTAATANTYNTGTSAPTNTSITNQLSTSVVTRTTTP